MGHIRFFWAQHVSEVYIYIYIYEVQCLCDILQRTRSIDNTPGLSLPFPTHNSHSVSLTFPPLWHIS